MGSKKISFTKDIVCEGELPDSPGWNVCFPGNGLFWRILSNPESDGNQASNTKTPRQRDKCHRCKGGGIRWKTSPLNLCPSPETRYSYPGGGTVPVLAWCPNPFWLITQPSRSVNTGSFHLRGWAAGSQNLSLLSSASLDPAFHRILK